MRAPFSWFLRWAGNTAFVTLLAIVVIGLVSCGGGTNRSGGTGLTNAALNASSSPTPTGGGTTGGTTGGSGSSGTGGGSGSSGGSGSGGSGSGSGSGSGGGSTGGSGSGGTGGSGGGTGGSGGSGGSGGVSGTSLPPDADPTGAVQTFTTDPTGTIDTTAAFFQSLGTNGRSCSTCHVQGDGWSVSAADVQARFAKAQSNASGLSSDPIFQTVDGSTCNHDVDVTTPTGQAQAFTLLTGRGLIRISLSVPTTPGAEFTVDSVVSPYPCNETNPLSMYRRPLPTANLRFLTSVMWDGRESSALTATKDITRASTSADLLSDLAHQAVDATLIHAQGSVATPLTAAQQQAMVNAEMALSVAQSSDAIAGSLQADGTTGGPAALSTQPFSIGVNDPFSSVFNFSVFTLFNNWSNSATAQKASIYRGQQLFSTRFLNITNVPGFNDTFFGGGPASEPCGYCHDSPNVGNHSLAVPMNIGVANLSTNPVVPNPLDVSYLPVFTLHNTTANPPTPATVQTTDPGVALITGKWVDIGKVKVPILRGLASRAPYFHNGAALTLSDVVNFYDQRFKIGFTPQEKADLVAFLSTL